MLGVWYDGWSTSVTTTPIGGSSRHAVVTFPKTPSTTIPIYLNWDISYDPNTGQLRNLMITNAVGISSIFLDHGSAELYLDSVHSNVYLELQEY